MDARKGWLALSLAGLVVTTAGPAAAGPAAAGESGLVVRVHNLPELPLPLVTEATQEADRVLREAGVDVEWVICPCHW